MTSRPRGRPVGSKAQTEWADAIRMAVKEAEGNSKRLRLLADRLVAKAMEGDVQALKEIGDRLDGKPKQSIDTNVTGESVFVMRLPERAKPGEWGGE